MTIIYRNPEYCTRSPMSSQMRKALILLRDARQTDDPLAYLWPEIGLRTIRALKGRGWIVAAPRLDDEATRYSITDSGLAALDGYRPSLPRSTDILCPHCKQRPRAARPGGTFYTYCRDCRNLLQKRARLRRVLLGSRNMGGVTTYADH